MQRSTVGQHAEIKNRGIKASRNKIKKKNLKIILEGSKRVPEEKENVCDIMSFKLFI